MRSPEILVIGTDRPTYVARVVPGLDSMPNGTAVVVDESDFCRIVPVGCLSHPQAVHYARHWAVQTGRSVAEVYIPESLR